MTTEMNPQPADVPALVADGAAHNPAAEWREFADLEDSVPKHASQVKPLRPISNQVLKPDVVIIGGGPVGLWTAIQVRLRSPDAVVLVLEKYAQYQRKHVLRINRDSLKGVPQDDTLAELCRNIAGVIRTSDLEERLLQVATCHDVHVKIETAASVESVIETYPTAKVIIGADGARSLVRDAICEGRGDETLSVNDTLQNVVDLR